MRGRAGVLAQRRTLRQPMHELVNMQWWSILSTIALHVRQ